MKAFHTTSERRWKALERDTMADSGGRTRLKDIQFSLDGEDNAPTNTVWEFNTLTLPQCVWTNPSLAVSSRVPGMARYESVGLRYALESLMEQQSWNEIWEQVFTDAFAWRGVTMVTTEQTTAPRYMDGLELVDWKGKKRKVKAGDKIRAPRLVYIHPEDYFMDSEVRTAAQARRMGHRWVDSKTRIRKLAEDDKTWNVDAIDAYSGTENVHDDDLITLWQMYVPNYIDPEALNSYEGDEEPGKDDLHHGTMYTMIESSSGGSDIRKPRVYRGPARGPYQVYECIPMPGRRQRVGPLAATWKQIDLDARVGEALNRSSENYKRQVVATEEIAEAILNSEHDGVIAVGLAPDLLQNGLKEIEIGGPSEQLIRGYDITRGSLIRTLSLSDTQLGAAQKGTTATGESIADKNVGLRTGGLANPLQRAAERQIGIAGWHVMHDDTFLITLPEEAKTEGLQMLKDGGLPIGDEALLEDDGGAVVYTGGDALKMDPASAFDAYLIKIEAMSMEKTSEHMQQRRILQEAELTEKALALKAQFPEFDAKGWLNDVGKKLNSPNLGKFIPDSAPAPAVGPDGAPVAEGGQGVQGNVSGGMAQGAAV